MKICFVMPRNMSFAPASATSIDLCVHDLALHSRYRDSITVLGEPVAAPFTDVRFLPVPRPRAGGQGAYAAALARALTREKPDIVVVEQHVDTAGAIARRLPGLPVVLQRHGMSRSYRSLWYRWRYGRLYRRMAAITAVSEALAENIRGNFPGLAARVAVVPNGIDTALWQPAQKEPCLAFAGRAVPEKGVEELAEALPTLLARHPGWRAELLLATAPRDAAFVATLRRLLAPAGDAVTLRENVPLDAVRHLFARAAIALVPSIMKEGFGRTALEAQAAGAALVSSGSGALREVSGDSALYLDAVTPQAIDATTSRLMEDASLLARMQGLSLQRAAGFDIRRCTAIFDDLCERLV